MCEAKTIAISADTPSGVAQILRGNLESRGYKVVAFGSAERGEDAEWVSVSVRVAEAVQQGRAKFGVVCCHTGTGASIAANKVSGIRAALCSDAYTAAGARRWNNANVLALSLRTTSSVMLDEILDAWFDTKDDGSQAGSLAYLAAIEG